jgi:hypothetical protein
VSEDAKMLWKFAAKLSLLVWLGFWLIMTIQSVDPRRGPRNPAWMEAPPQPSASPSGESTK